MEYIVRNMQTQACLYSWDNTVNHNENEDESEKRSHWSDINKCLGMQKQPPEVFF